MKRMLASLVIAAGLALSVSNAVAAPLPTTITYQGELRFGAGAVTTNTDFEYRLFDDEFAGALVSGPLSATLTPDSNGRFTQQLNFGAAAYNGDARWLEVRVRNPAGGGAFTTLPRQPLNPAPHARFSATTGNALQLNGQSGSFYQNASNMNAGTLPSGRISGLYSNAVNYNNAGNSFTGTFIGNGGGLTNISATSISGTIPDGNLSANVALLNRNPQTFTGNNTFANNARVDGFLGVNTSTAIGQSALVVSRTAGANAYAGMQVNGTNAGSWPFYGYSTAGAVQAWTYYNGTLDSWNLFNGTDQMTMTGGGFLGINETSPLTFLHVKRGESGQTGIVSPAIAAFESNTNGYITIQTPGANTAGLVFGTDTAVFEGGIYYNFPGTLNGLSLRVGANAEAMNLQSNGNVGIGANPPDFRLDVGQRMRVQGNDTGSTPGIWFSNPTEGNEGFIGMVDVDHIGLWGSSGAGWGINMNTGTGEVRIGSTTAADETHRLVVRGTSETFRLIGNVGDFLHNAAMNFGDSDFVYLWEDTDDHIQMNARLGWTVTNGAAATDFQCIGTMSKGAGAFKIDHPLDPENKYLYHSFVESPDMMNIYNGVVTTDSQGFATVTLPDYFTGLNRDYRYQLTVIDESENDFIFAKVYRKVENNEFIIKTSQPDVEVSWQVTGIRQDAFANSDRIPNVVDKEPENKGKYLHPASFGQPESRGIHTSTPGGGFIGDQKKAASAN